MNDTFLIGSRVKEIRKESGLNQEDFGKTLGLSRLQITRYEGGKYKPPRSILEKISTIYNVSIDWLLKGRGAKYLGSGRELTWEDTKEFFSRHPNIEEQKPGLYKMLQEADYREALGIRENEAEFLAQVELVGVGGHATTEMWAQELKTYRDRQAQLDLSPEEKQIIQYIRLMPEEDRARARDIIETLATRGKKK